jgi:hypothetical protein
MYLPVHSINYWVLTIAKIPSNEKDGGFNVMSMGRNGSGLANFLIVNYGPQYYYCSFQIQPDDSDTCGLYCLYYFNWRHRGGELPDIVKDFSPADLNGNEDKILRFYMN